MVLFFTEYPSEYPFHFVMLKAFGDINFEFFDLLISFTEAGLGGQVSQLACPEADSFNSEC